MRLIISPFNEFLSFTKKQVLLGEWLKIKKKNFKNIPSVEYHWKDRIKFKKDFKYIDETIIKIIQDLTLILNKVHKSNYSHNFWSIVLFPWVSFFLSSVFDRWENLKKALEVYKICEIPIYNDVYFNLPKDFNEFLQINDDHLWNHKLFSDILKFQKNKKLKLLEKKKIIKINNHKNFNLLKNFKKLIDFFLLRFTKNNKIIFFSSYFDKINFIKLNFYLKQLPRYYFEFFKKNKSYKINYRLRKKLSLSISSSQFEKFISKYIFLNLPKSYLEDFEEIMKNVKEINLNPKIIITGNIFFPTELARFWTAFQKENHTPLILNEHGGSIPLKYRYYSLLDKIFDKKITWSKVLKKKQIQLSPSNLIQFKHLKSKKKIISIITLDVSKYAFKCTNLQSSIILDDYKKNLILMSELGKNKINFKIKPYRTSNWGLVNKYQNFFKKNIIMKEKNLKSVLLKSKLVICTYPDTTFMQSIVSGIPTVLVFLNKIYSFDKNFTNLVNKLYEKKIIFSDPILAVEHIKTIHKDPYKWWCSDEIVKLRNIICKQCGNVSNYWLSEWKNFIIKSAKEN